VADYAELRKWGMSIQSFYLLPKIRELDCLLNAESQARIYESHPELIWTRLAGVPLDESKKTKEGQGLRCQLLPFELPSWDYPRKWVATDDVIDALGLWLSASQAQAQWRLPSGVEERDQRGLRMEIRA
jgi:predicted RNase H-like nuclease